MNSKAWLWRSVTQTLLGKRAWPSTAHFLPFTLLACSTIWSAHAAGTDLKATEEPSDTLQYRKGWSAAGKDVSVHGTDLISSHTGHRSSSLALVSALFTLGSQGPCTALLTLLCLGNAPLTSQPVTPLMLPLLDPCSPMLSTPLVCQVLANHSTSGCSAPSLPDETLRPLPTHPVCSASCFQHTL